MATKTQKERVFWCGEPVRNVVGFVICECKSHVVINAKKPNGAYGIQKLDLSDDPMNYRGWKEKYSDETTAVELLKEIRAAWVRTDNGKDVAMAHTMKKANDLLEDL